MRRYTLLSVASIITWLALTYVQPSNGAKILAASFVTGKSHKITYDPILLELAKRGHEVISLSPIPSKSNSTNPREIMTFDFGEFMKKTIDMFDMKMKGVKPSPFTFIAEFSALCRDTYALPAVQELLSQKFDLVFTEPFMNECMAGFLYKLNTTIVLYTSFSAPSYLIRQLGGPAPPSFIPSIFSSFDNKMSFMERTQNFLEEALMVAGNQFFFIPHMEALYREALNDPTIPGVLEVLQSSSLTISNSHFALGGSRPFMPDVVEVGGMHLRAAKPLPTDLENFVNSSGEHGFIFFSMGSVLIGSDITESRRLALLNAFSKLKQKVLWKWETETMADLPPNVKLTKWAPQQDILGHPKIRAFITHGGLGSTTESIYHGVPIIGIPMFGDQLTNMEKFVRKEIGLQLEFTTFTEEDVLDAIQAVLNEAKYSRNVKALSAIFRDQRDDPLERAIYWIEYVLRHKGAAHLRSPARDLNGFQYHSLDVISTIFLILAVVFYVLYALIKLTLRLLGLLKAKQGASVVTTKKGKKVN